MNATGLITHLRHVDIAMPNFAEQRTFYRDTWGLTETADDSGVSFLAAEGSPELPQQRVPSTDHAESAATNRAQACPASASPMLVNCSVSGRVRRETVWLTGELLDERHRRAVVVPAAEPAHGDVETGLAPTDGDVREPAAIPAMRAGRHGATVRARRRRLRRAHREHHDITVEVDRRHANRRQMRERHFKPLISARASELPSSTAKTPTDTPTTRNKIRDRADDLTHPSQSAEASSGAAANAAS
ncbi:hypothetical protein [Amycolatopsis anabasis]|uniref:hypothetical protein n=1 Tax=Amycolatopsis anabasis TaxID=1840409 RepID=UPI001FECC9A0|nr:hypothetical protein [Amycolatopsis anabasis]